MNADILPTFIRSAEAVGCIVDTAETIDDAREKVLQTLQLYSAKVVWIWATPLLQSLNLKEELGDAGVTFVGGIEGGNRVEIHLWKQAEVGITEVDYGIAETGTMVLGAGAGRPRSASLLPPIHLALLPISHILPTLKSFFHLNHPALQSNTFFFITGPSRTADIEQTLTLGVHGPRKVHILLLAFS